MRILSLIPDVQEIVHEIDGKAVEFKADAVGGFEVPDEIGRILINFPHWVQDLGHKAAEAAAAAAGDLHTMLAAAQEEIAALKAQLADKPAKTPAAKKSSAPAGPPSA